jgi:hypothetical protein
VTRPSDRGGQWRDEYDRVGNRVRLELTPDLTTRWATGNDNFVSSSLWDFKSSFTCSKILRHGTLPLYFPSERKVCCGFLSPLKNLSPWIGFEPATLGSSGQHSNHYTTKANYSFIKVIYCCSFNKSGSPRLNSEHTFVAPYHKLWI